MKIKEQRCDLLVLIRQNVVINLGSKMHHFYYSWGKMGADGSLSMAIVNEH